MIPLILISMADKTNIDVKVQKSAYLWIRAIAWKGLITRKERERGSWANILIDLRIRIMAMLTFK